ncbi:hypothetical protein EV667_0702 [Ancylobacter aquaticus]|uniref:Uncharacterized protein n=1 Tax=Ancylobacter aquaticus TaxID=100 RepID=A0A4R1IBV8_ANCAQ|nr:hypothetical protein EV667_0702 [Ancylobacter aquaticus]
MIDDADAAPGLPFGSALPWGRLFRAGPAVSRQQAGPLPLAGNVAAG